VLAIPACVGDAGSLPTVAGKSPEAAAEVSTDVACEYLERCGQISVVCADCDNGDCGGCSVEREEVEYAQCADELKPSLVAGFGCAALTPEQEMLVDTCLRALSDLSCVSVEQVEAWANGGGGDDPRDIPEPCDVLEDILGCHDDTDGRPRSPSPG
jgi:hypothetical protein